MCAYVCSWKQNHEQNIQKCIIQRAKWWKQVVIMVNVTLSEHGYTFVFFFLLLFSVSFSCSFYSFASRPQHLFTWYVTYFNGTGRKMLLMMTMMMTASTNFWLMSTKEKRMQIMNGTIKAFTFVSDNPKPYRSFYFCCLVFVFS